MKQIFSAHKFAKVEWNWSDLSIVIKMQFAINLIREYLFMGAIDLVTFLSSFITPGLLVDVCVCI